MPGLILDYILRLLSVLSLKNLYRLSEVISFFIVRTPNRISNYTDRNLRICFAHLDQQQRKMLARKSIRHAAYTMFELAPMWRWPADKLLKLVNSEKVCSEFDQSSGGRIIIAPHLGNWELLNLWLAGRQHGFMSLYKPQDNDSLDQYILKARSRNGAQLLPTNATGLRQVSRGLKQGKTLMLLPDQRPGKSAKRIRVDFFGQPASISPLVNSLCSRIDCDVFIAAMFRNSSLSGFELIIKKLDHSALSGEQAKSLLYLNQQIETLIKIHPEQYVWGYRRFPVLTYRSQD